MRGPFGFGQTVTERALIGPPTKHEENTLPDVLMREPSLIYYGDVAIQNAIKLKMPLNFKVNWELIVL